MSLVMRVGATAGFLWLLNMFAVLVVDIAYGAANGMHSPAPDYLVTWALISVIPVGLALVGLVGWGAVAVVRMWRDA